MIKSVITDKSNGYSASVQNEHGEEYALVVATRPLKTFENKPLFFTNSTYGINMNQNAAPSGTPEKVHNGTDTTLWTASDIVGGAKTTFNQDDQHAHGGIITIVNANNCAGDTQTIGINGIDTIKTEGVDWNLVAGNNNATATALAAELDSITGVSASASGAVVTIIANLGYDITKIDTSDAVNCPGTARAIKVDNTATNDIYQFAKSGDLDMTNYSAITMWIYITQNWLAGDSVTIQGYDTGTAAYVGNSVALENYFNFSEYNVWHKITISVEDMGTLASYATLDALRFTQATRQGTAPTYYIDDLQIEAIGTSQALKYSIQPNKGTWLHVDKFVISIVDAYTGTLANGTMPSLPYNKFLGVDQLDNGFVYQRKNSGKITSIPNIQSLLDVLQLPGTVVSGYGSDGTNTWVTVLAEFTEPIVLKSEEDDEMSFIISDDLSGLLRLRIAAGCKEEVR